MAETLARKTGVPLGQCPTCGARQIEVADGVYGWENGTYKYHGVEHDCDCDTQIQLRKHYLLANIGDQYQRLDWRDYIGSDTVREGVSAFLDNWDSFKRLGMGVEFTSATLGTGKTFAATYIAKELIKRGEDVYFLPFLEFIGLLNHAQAYRTEQENRLRDTTVLILDEVVPAHTAAQGALFATKFEELIRHRTNFNQVTIMTTNLSGDELHTQYPRTYSLLEAKQIRVEMRGDDARRGMIAKRNLEMALNDEVAPIV